MERLASDPELRARLRENGLRTAQRHTEAVFNAAVEEAVLEAADLTPPSAPDSAVVA